MKPIYLLVGSPGVGKTWVTSQLETHYQVMPHDAYIGKNYTQAVYEAAPKTSKSILIETPFSVSQIVEPLTKAGLEVIPMFIIENEAVHRERYETRSGKDLPKGHLTRTKTYLERAIAGKHFYGTAKQVLERLTDYATD